jgi:hypothetical protein
MSDGGARYGQAAHEPEKIAPRARLCGANATRSMYQTTSQSTQTGHPVPGPTRDCPLPFQRDKVVDLTSGIVPVGRSQRADWLAV